MKPSPRGAGLLAVLLRLYPAEYRRFGAERQVVLDEAFSEAARDGRLAVARLCWREIRDLPGSLWQAHQHAWEGIMAISESETQGEKLRWLGILPFVLMGTALLLMQFPEEVIQPNSTMAVLGIVLILGGFLTILGGLLAGMLAGFPRWSFPYLIYGFLFSLYLSFTATPGLVIFNSEVKLWGWWAFLPFDTVILVGLLRSRPFWKPLVSLGRGVRRDASRLSFGLFGFLPFVLLILMDEVNHTFGFPYLLAGEILLVVGASLYIVLRSTGARVAALAAATFLAAFSAGFGSHLFWARYTVNFATGATQIIENPVPLAGVLAQSWNPALVLTLLILSPVLPGMLWQGIGWLRRAMQHGG
jgi:hypothetical protein